MRRGLKYRVSAALIDILILGLISYVMMVNFGHPFSTTDSTGYRIDGWPAFFLFLIDLGLIPIQEGLTGKTIGKRIAQIKVVKDDFSEITVGTSIVRHVFDIVDFMLFAGLFVASSTRKSKGSGI
jgi:uncharacterized RDD family membrane protein YckC